MKVKITPLLIIATLLLVYGFYLLFARDEGRWGELAGAVVTSLSFGMFVVYVLLRLIFGREWKRQMVVEILLLTGAILLYHFS